MLAKQNASGLIAGNPIAVQALGLCPALAVTTTLLNAVGMAAITLVVLAASCLLASLMRRLTQGPLQLFSCIIIITTLVTIAELLMWAIAPRLAQALGPFLPLVVVNCLILSRTASFASRKQAHASVVDAVGHGLGFALALLAIAFIRELLGEGSLTVGGLGLWSEAIDLQWGPVNLVLHNGQILTPLYRGAPLRFLQLPAGALFLLAYFSGTMQHHLARRRIKQLRGMQK